MPRARVNISENKYPTWNDWFEAACCQGVMGVGSSVRVRQRFVSASLQPRGCVHLNLVMFPRCVLRYPPLPSHPLLPHFFLQTKLKWGSQPQFGDWGTSQPASAGSLRHLASRLMVFAGTGSGGGRVSGPPLYIYIYIYRLGALFVLFVVLCSTCTTVVRISVQN